MTDEIPKNGLSTYFYINSKQKKSEGEYKDGKQEGRWIEWWINGQKMSEGNYKDGKKDGNWTWWFMEGGNQCVGEYKDGSEVGNWVWWDENGERIFSGDYKDGIVTIDSRFRDFQVHTLIENISKESDKVAFNSNKNKGTQEVKIKGTQTVKVSDFDMPFVSMIIFMVKWAIASIPAILILIVLFAIFGGLLGILS